MTMDDQTKDSLDENAHTVSSESISSDALSSEDFKEQTTNPGLVSRVIGGAYNTTTTILGGAKQVATTGVGGATWITGTAFSTSLGVVKGVGSFVLPARFRPAEPKDKAD